MNVREALAACEATVRRADPDRYLASLFAPTGVRPLLFALYAFDYELTHAIQVAREPMMVEIRLQWWRETVDAAAHGKPAAHPAAVGLAEIFSRASLGADSFVQLIDAHEPHDAVADCSGTDALEAQAGSISAALMRLAAILLDPAFEMNETMGEVAIAYGLVRFLQSLPYLVMRGKFPAPDAAAQNMAAARIACAAHEHYARVRGTSLPKRALAALLPGALVPSYLADSRRTQAALRERIEIAPVRRQLVLLRAAVLGRL